MKNIIIVRWESIEGEQKQAWSSLTKLCSCLELPYHSIKMMDYPFEIDGYRFEKLEIRR